MVSMTGKDSKSGGTHRPGKRDVLNYLGIVAIIFLLNYICSFFIGRFDITEDKRHSLSENTIALLQDENSPDRGNKSIDQTFLKAFESLKTA